ncbi:hypothetical protein RND71_019307 [Anisodus tanguticus]|uniref:Uncharacterized protein n=1 Tax=Anisodus tanguticus TaxID=243964 RepID=A0AAE1VHA7_9SOLA|nr:hypothetical protein RND71_019307 [Anisodus tanguticus]
MAKEVSLKSSWRPAAWVRILVGALCSLLGWDLVGDISCSVLKSWSFRHIPRFIGSSVEGPVLLFSGIVWRKPGS